jgi:hypothetical protein
LAVFKKILFDDKEDVGQPKVMTLQNLPICFEILIIGLILSVFIFIAEFWWKLLKKHNLITVEMN